MILHLDFETRSTVDLKAVGLDVYSRHPSTEAMCMAHAFDEDAVYLLAPSWPRERITFWNYVEAGGLVYAHNAAFEFAIWNNIMVPRFGWPALRIEQMRCTMAMSYAMALPGSLDGAAGALGLTQRKDPAGHRLMLQMCKPKGFDALGDPIWQEEPKKLERLYAYCRQDVEVERALHKRLVELSPAEQEVWAGLDHEVNNRGVYVDAPAVESSIALADQEQVRLNASVRAATDGAVATCNATGQLGDWIRLQGVAIDGVAKADVVDALNAENTPPKVRTVLLLRQEAAKASTAKLKQMRDRRSADGRLRGMYQFHGAGPGRWTGRNPQLANLPRYRNGVDYKNVEHMIELICAGKRDELDMLYGPVMPAIADCVRGMVRAAPGHDLIAVDFSSIQGRLVPWSAGEEWKVQAFRDYDAGIGPDNYILTYAESFGVDWRTISKKDWRRQVGKVEELAFLFGGSIGAWRTMEKTYHPPAMSDDQVKDINRRWRALHPKIADYDTGYWVQLDNAAIQATLNPGRVFTAGVPGREVKFKKVGSFLWLGLPSGRVICYPYPEVRLLETPWGQMKDTFTYKTELMGEALKKAKIVDDPSNGGGWWRISTYGGSLCENVAMAEERDLLVAAMLRLRQRDYAIVMHTYDEVIVEVPETAPPETLQIVEGIVAESVPWSTGLPIAVEGWRSKRNRK